MELSQCYSTLEYEPDNFYLKIQFLNLFSDPMIYLCNQSELFEEMLMGDNSQGTFR